jgi:tRNA threonylcarbamoyladenosine biosynthesis protein TsaB
VSALDAGRGDIYAGEYDVTDNAAILVREHLLTRSEFLTETQGQKIATPDAVLAEALRTAGSAVQAVEPLSAAVVAQLGWRKIQAGAVVSPEMLEANYIRRTDAEIFARSPQPSTKPC